MFILQKNPLLELKCHRPVFIDFWLPLIERIKGYDLIMRFGIQAKSFSRDFGQPKELALHNDPELYDVSNLLFTPSDTLRVGV